MRISRLFQPKAQRLEKKRPAGNRRALNFNFAAERWRLAAEPPNPQRSLDNQRRRKPPIRQRGRSRASRRDASIPAAPRHACELSAVSS
jgi:hypothetical protein